MLALFRLLGIAIAGTAFVGHMTGGSDEAAEPDNDQDPQLYAQELEAILNGTNDLDEIFAGDDDNTVQALDGDNYVDGEAGNDTLFGDDGNDQLFGGAGDDAIEGGAGEDKVFGSIGDDALNGGDGDDQLHGGDGHDTLEGAYDDDRLIGGDGDILSGGPGADVFEVDNGTVTIMDWEEGDVLAFHYVGAPPELTAPTNATRLIVMANGAPLVEMVGITEFDVTAIRLIAA